MLVLSEKIYYSLLRSTHKNIVCFLPRGGEHAPVGISPSALNSLAITRAHELRGKLPHSRQPLLIAMEAGLEFVVTLLACLYAGITLIPVPVPKVKSDKQRIEAIVKDANVTTILLTSRSNAMLKKLNFESVKLHLHVVEPISFDAHSTPVSMLPPVFEKHRNEVTIIQYTSGSTSDPKGVQITNANILANHDLVESKWRFKPDKSFLSWLPHFHDMGLFGGILYPLMSGMKLFLMSPEDFIKKPTRWLNAISQYRIHCSGGPPFSYQLCLRSLKEMQEPLPEWDFSNWKVAFCGADYIPYKLLVDFREQLSENGLSANAVIGCYGLAESTLFVAGEREWIVSQNDQPVAENLTTASVGMLLNESDYHERLCIYDCASDEVINSQDVGEVLISGDSISPSYVSQPLDEIYIREKKWVKTGDLGFISNQRLYITGRIKNLIVSNGKNIFQDDILQAIQQLGLMLNTFAAVILQPSTLDNKFVLLIERERKAQPYPTPAQLEDCIHKIRNSVNTEFGLYLSNIMILKRGTLPRTTSGKIQRSAALNMYQQSLFN